MAARATDPTGWIVSASAQQEQEADVCHARGHSVDDAARGIPAVGAVLERSRDQHYPSERDRERRQYLSTGALGEHRPGHQRDEYHLDVGQNGRQAGVSKSLTNPVTLIGRAPGCDIRLNVESIHPLHCALLPGPDAILGGPTFEAWLDSAS